MSDTPFVADSSAWELIDDNPFTGQQRWRLPLGDGLFVVKTVTKVLKSVLDSNAERRATAAGTGWGDGACVASVPLNIFYDELHEAVRVGDDKYINKWLNDPDHAAFRTREGRL